MASKPIWDCNSPPLTLTLTLTLTPPSPRAQTETRPTLKLNTAHNVKNIYIIPVVTGQCKESNKDTK